MKTHNALLSLLLFTAPALAQDRAQAQGQEPFLLPKGEISVTNLIDSCAAYLGWNILYDGRELAGSQGAANTNLQRQIVTDAEGCEELLYSLLHRHGLAVTPLDPRRKVYEVILMNGPRGREVMNRATQKSPEQILARPNLKAPVLAVVQLEHINAQLANNSLRPFFAASGGHGQGLSIGNIGSSTGLLLQGFQDQVAQAILMIRICDVEQPPQPHTGRGMSDYLEKLEKRIEKLEERIAAMSKKAR